MALEGPWEDGYYLQRGGNLYGVHVWVCRDGRMFATNKRRPDGCKDRGRKAGGDWMAGCCWYGPVPFCPWDAPKKDPVAPA